MTERASLPRLDEVCEEADTCEECETAERCPWNEYVKDIERKIAKKEL